MVQDYFSSPEFTSAVGEFLSANANAIQFVAQEAEQPLQNHQIFQEYTSVVEQQLQKWLTKESLSPQVGMTMHVHVVAEHTCAQLTGRMATQHECT